MMMNTTFPVQYFNDFIDFIPQPVCLLKACNKVVYAWNDEFRKLTGYPQPEIKGKPWSLIFDLAEKADWKSWIIELNKKGSVNDIPVRIINSRGKKISAIFSLKRINLEGDDYFICTITNVATFIAQDQKNRKKLIRDQRLRFHYENSPLAIVEWDNDYNVTRWSRKAEKIFGYKAKETMDKPIYSLNLIHPEDLQIVEMTMERLSGGKERTVVSGNRNITKDGRVIHCIWYNSVLLDENGKVVSIMSLVDDVTDQREKEEKIRQYAEDLEQMVRERTGELNHLKDNLEELVRERTTDLEANNRKLTKEIVARRRAVEALKESERKYREIVQNIPGMVFQLKVQRDGSNRFNYISPHAGDLFDLPYEDISNDWEFTNYIHPDDRSEFISSIGRAISDHTPWKYEGRILTPGNQIKWFEGFSSPALVGQELVLDGIMLDVTEKKLAQEAMRISEQHFRSLFTSIEEGFHMSRLIYDENGKAIDWEFLVVNEAFENQTGLKRTDLIGKRVTEVLPAIEPVWLETYEKIVKTGIPEHFEEYNKDTDRLYYLFAYPTYADNFAVIFYDRTEKKDFHEKVLEAQRNAMESQKRFSALFDAMTEGVIVMEVIFDEAEENPVDWIYLSVNPAWKKHTGINKDVTGKKLHEIIIDPEPVWLETVGRVAKTGIPETLESYNAFIGRYFFSYTYKLKDHQCVMVFKDITEQKDIQHQLELKEKRFRVLFETMKEGFQIIEIIFDSDGNAADLKYILVNAAWYNQTGIKEDVTGRLATEVFPGLEKVWTEKLGQVAKTGEPMEIEDYNAFSNRFYSIYALPLESNIVASVFQDITRQRQEENEIKINLTKYQVLFESFPLGITITDQIGQIVEINNKATEILEIDKEDVKDRTIADRKWNIIRPDGTLMPSDEYASVQALNTNSIISNQELGLLRDNGEVKWLNVTAAPIPLKGYGVAIAYSDVSDRIHDRETLEEKERSYKTLFNVISEGYGIHEIIVDEHGEPVDYRFKEVNPAFEKITGLKRDQVVGKRVSEIFPNLEKDWIRTYGEIALSGKTATFENYSHELKKYFEVFAYSPAYGQFATIFVDISQKKNLSHGKKIKH